MGKKNRNKGKFRGSLGDTLSRLATTVKADAATLIMGSKITPSGTVKSEGYVSPFAMKPEAKPKSRLSQLAGRMVPFKRTPLQTWKDRKASKKLKRLAKQMASQGNHNMIKIRRSRLPLVIALLVVAIGFGGYYMFRSVTLPDVKMSNVVDYKKWLSTTSGQAPKAPATVKHSTKVVRSYKVTKDGRHVSKHGKSKHGKSKFAKGKKHHGKAKLAKGEKHQGKAKLAKGTRGKSKVKRASHKR